MPENWYGIAGEVEEALRSVGQTSEGFTVVIKYSVATAPNPKPYEPPVSTPEYVQLVGVFDSKQVLDLDGTLIDKLKHVVSVNADAGFEPKAGMYVGLGITIFQAGDHKVWHHILRVIPLAPAGIPVMYDLELEM